MKKKIMKKIFARKKLKFLQFFIQNLILLKILAIQKNSIKKPCSNVNISYKKNPQIKKLENEKIMKSVLNSREFNFKDDKITIPKIDKNNSFSKKSIIIEVKF